MKTHTTTFKDKIKDMGRMLYVRVSWNNNANYVDNLNIVSMNLHYEADLLKSVMKQLDLESKVNITEGTIITVTAGIITQITQDGRELAESLNYGQFVVYKSEKAEDGNYYKITCYDKMIYAMKQNEDLQITYPITIKNYLNAVANKIGLQVEDTTFYNQNLQIPAELFVGLEYTYRDILDNIAEATGSIICINSNNKIEVRYPNQTNDTINEEYLKDTNINFGEAYGPINTIVLSRAGESDNVYIQDAESVSQNGRCELKIVDNQIMNGNNRSDYLQGILNGVDGLTYSINDFASTGITYYDVYDQYTVEANNNTYSCLMLNDEIIWDSGLTENIHTELPNPSVTDYTKADKTDRKINQTYIIVDKQNQIIESVVSNVTEQDEKISQITQTVDELNSKISDIADITESQETLTGTLSFTNINASEPIRVEIKATGENISYLYPFNLLYPANNLYIKLRTLRFTNTTTNEVFNYELPDDLLYYDSNNYDSFLLDYEAEAGQENPKVYVYKKCQYNTNTGAVEALATPRTDSYDFPSINLTDGNYTVSVLKYDNTPYNCYFFLRLMKQNIYTTQFATRAEMNTEISQTATSINLSVDQKLTNYSTTNQMNSAIELKANQITSTVSQTYETKQNATQHYSQITQTTDSINLAVGTKVGYDEVINSINLSNEGLTINANKISLAGKQISLTSDNITITSNNFSVDKYGTVNCTGATIEGNITANSGTIGGFSVGQYNIQSGSGSSKIRLNSNPSTATAIWIGADEPGDAPFKVTKAGKLTAREAVFDSCTIKNNCTVPASTINGTLATSTIPNMSAAKITSGTMSASRISGGTMTGATFSGGTISGSSVSATTIYSVGSIEVGLGGSFVYNNEEGKDFKLIVQHEGNKWRRLTFQGGILTKVESSW